VKLPVAHFNFSITFALLNRSPFIFISSCVRWERSKKHYITKREVTCLSRQENGLDILFGVQGAENTAGCFRLVFIYPSVLINQEVNNLTSTDEIFVYRRKQKNVPSF
jgi:hypothetical protein